MSIRDEKALEEHGDEGASKRLTTQGRDFLTSGGIDEFKITYCAGGLETMADSLSVLLKPSIVMCR